MRSLTTVALGALMLAVLVQPQALRAQQTAPKEHKRAPLASPSSASYSCIDQTATPIAATPSSTVSNCARSSGGPPSSLL